MKVLKHGPQDLPVSAEFDLVVVGAGGAGLASALFAALEGASVLLIESSAQVGGTTAWSAGTSWIPGTHHAAQVNPSDTLAEAERYLDNAVGQRAPRELRQAFFAQGPAAVQALEQHTAMAYRPYPKHPDYLSDLGGSSLSGRALEPLPFDGRLLGELFELLRPPIPEFTVLGGMMVDRSDIHHLLAMGRSWSSFRHSARILLRHARDRLSYPRGTRLVMGNALVARLLYSLAQHPGVTLALGTSLERIDRRAQAVQAIEISGGGQMRHVRVGKALVLASGGFNRHPELRPELLPGVPPEWSPAAPGRGGQVHALARQAGAALHAASPSHALWAPVSMRRRADGSTAVFPHFVMDRAKPGMITVNQAGRRFVNESTSYHLFGLAMQEAHRQTPSIPAYLICDERALRAYGLGMVRPGGRGLQPFLADGYLVRGQTLAELAQQLAVDAVALQETVSRFNQHARDGQDPDFGRGQTAYQQNLGDPTWPGSNPSLGPLTQAPFFAIRLYPGDIGAATGLATTAQAQVLGTDGQAIGGLYAVGNDMQSIMGGVYPAPGITLGPGQVFARIAVRHALGLPA